MFFVDRNTGELILPIQADHFVQQPKMFVVSVEPLGGGSALTARCWPGRTAWGREKTT